jgi:putative aldouronate transport system permease protein
MRRRSFAYNIFRYRSLYLMALPAVLGFLLFSYIPSIGAIVIPFTRYNIVDGFFRSPWVGLKWFVTFATDPFFFRLLRNTLLIGLYSLLFGFPAPIILALSLNEIRGGFFKRFAQSVTYLPHFISSVVLVGMIYMFFGHSGIINVLVTAFGGRAVDFLTSIRWFRPLYIGSGIWQGIGWGSIVYLAAIAGVNPELYEASFIEGANRFQRALHITLPSMAPTVTVMLILSTSSIISVGFEKVYLMMNPAIYSVADVVATYVYRRGIEGLDYSYAAAVGLFNSVVALLLLLTANRISRAVSENSLW